MKLKARELTKVTKNCINIVEYNTGKKKWPPNFLLSMKSFEQPQQTSFISKSQEKVTVVTTQTRPISPGQNVKFSIVAGESFIQDIGFAYCCIDF